jgi:TetR/AcrR family tetracycline transcriptional repressor
MESAERLDLPWWPKERGRAAGREPLSRDQIVGAAIRLIDRDGLEALSMRRLGHELDAGATSLYWHVQNKDVLLALVSDAISGEIVAEVPDDASAPWEDQVMAFARAVRRILVERHPRAVLLFSSRAKLGPHTLVLIERLLGVLRLGGLEGKRLFLAYWAILNYAYSYAIVDSVSAGVGAPSDMVGGQPNAAPAQLLASLPEERFPNFLDVIRASSEASPEERFEYGLRRLLDGIAVERKRLHAQPS